MRRNFLQDLCRMVIQMDKEKRKVSCTFTGHRPEKLDADEEHFLREMSGWWIMRRCF